MEITNDSQAEKHRLYSLTKLVADQKQIGRQTILDVLQPQSLLKQSRLNDPISSGKTTLRVAEDFELIRPSNDKTYVLAIPQEHIRSMEAFRQHISTVIFGATENHHSNYIFNLFSAWYATQDERVLDEATLPNYDISFCEELFPDVPPDKRPFNSTKLPAWRKWAEFLGLGYSARLRNKELIIPDATKRIKNVLSTIFTETNLMQFGTFMEYLALSCPELDGGLLFRRCWETTHSSEERGNQISLMLSTGLRTLDALHTIKLIYQADSINVWQLFPAQGSIQQSITHIEFI